MHGRAMFAAALLVAAFGGCSSSGHSSLTGTNGGTGGVNYNLATGTMKATVDGAQWTANYQTRASLTNGALSITGENYNGDLGQQRIVTMAVIAATAGTYTLSAPGDGHGGNAIMVLGGSKQWYSAQTGGTGSLTVTTINSTHVVGTFTFVGIGTNGIGNSTVTSGTFDIPF
jgi:hypothetical protein